MAEFVPFIALSTLAFESVSKLAQAAIKSQQPPSMSYSVSVGQLGAYITSLVHAVVAVVGAAAFLLRSIHLYDDRVFAVEHSASYLLAVSAGFFLHDLLDVVRRLRTFADFCYMVHHAICFSLYATSSLRQICQCWALVFLLYEASTPFLSLQNLMRAMNWGSPAALSVVRGTFAFVFILVRIVLGTVASLYVCRDLLPLMSLRPSHPDLLVSFPHYSEGAHPHPAILAFILICCGVFLLLNLYWAHLIMIRVRRAVSDRCLSRKITIK